jgi:hypothetical protein
MPCEARWITSVPASGLHAAERMLAGAAPVDGQLPAALVDEVAALADDLAAVGLEPAPFFEHAVPLAARGAPPRELARVVLTKTLGPRGDTGGIDLLARRLQTLAAAVDRALPNLLEELDLRSRPIREQWEARGPGLLAAARRLTDEDAVVEAAEVILVQPVAGGGGAAHPLYNAVRLEAVLANPLERLPEVVRLGWLWTQLHLDLPKFEEVVGRARLARVGRAGLVPVALAAAGEVELVRFDPPLVETALAAWNAPGVPAETLVAWWETYHAGETGWAAALAALAEMVGET